MEALFVLVPLSFILAGTALVAFIWATKKGQFSDLKSPGEQIIFDEYEVRPTKKIDINK
ncbi:MAG: cbb3-type cytochrome oxidase assembly protein CcoS [Proteobacteria bacterium]|nr:cbb3-type cytochrome oxidase assembly protein CcoS [Pseudomonadota bacterium]